MNGVSWISVVDDVSNMPWINIFLEQRAHGWQERISNTLGYLSILCWLNAQMPQVIKNYRLQNAESLSFSFLTVWLLGDIANFVGCVLTGQLAFQLYLSVYFITIDTVLCTQWLYYVRYPDNVIRRWSNPGRPVHEASALLPSPKPLTSRQQYQALLAVGWLVTMGMTPTVLTTSPHDTESSLDKRTRDLWIGRGFAWLCTCLYLSSRVPQILRNVRRHSVEGLSMALFFFAAAGNLTYTLSIFTSPHQTRQTLLEAVPYILGSAGTLLFDSTIFTQYLLYRQTPLGKIDSQTTVVA